MAARKRKTCNSRSRKKTTTLPTLEGGRETAPDAPRRLRVIRQSTDVEYHHERKTMPANPGMVSR
jgi:hypothetical protein